MDTWQEVKAIVDNDPQRRFAGPYQRYVVPPLEVAGGLSRRQSQDVQEEAERMIKAIRYYQEEVLLEYMKRHPWITIKRRVAETVSKGPLEPTDVSKVKELFAGRYDPVLEMFVGPSYSDVKSQYLSELRWILPHAGQPLK